LLFCRYSHHQLKLKLPEDSRCFSDVVVDDDDDDEEEELLLKQGLANVESSWGRFYESVPVLIYG
jgi:hypothetical protein